MLTIHASSLDGMPRDVIDDLHCVMVDYASVTAAEMKKQKTFEGCPFEAVVAVSIQSADDMAIPIFLCAVHFNSFKMGLGEGVAIDKELLTEEN